MSLIFSSTFPKASREATENLFFFNPRQYRVRKALVSALEKYGEPRIEERGESLCLSVGSGYAQTLVAFDSKRANQHPVGAVVFLRTSFTDLLILHLAVHPDYVLGGPDSDLGLAFEMIEKVREIGSRIKGITSLSLSYGAKTTFVVREQNSSATLRG